MAVEDRMINKRLTRTVLALLAVLLLSVCQQAAGSTPVSAPAVAPNRPPAGCWRLRRSWRISRRTLRATVSTIYVLIPIGVDPHGFEPTPADVRKVADSTLLIANGAGFESFLGKLLENAGGQRQLLEAGAGLTSRTAR